MNTNQVTSTTASVESNSNAATKPASPAQVNFLTKRAKMPTEDAMALSAKDAFKLIGSIIKRRRDAQRQPPTEAQLRFLEDQGYNRSAFAIRTRGYCSRLVYRIKAGKVAA